MKKCINSQKEPLRPRDKDKRRNVAHLNRPEKGVAHSKLGIRMMDEEKRKDLGAIYTPSQVAKFLVRWAIREPTDTILDAAAGATGELVDLVAERMVKERRVRMDRAKELLTELSAK